MVLFLRTFSTTTKPLLALGARQSTPRTMAIPQEIPPSKRAVWISEWTITARHDKTGIPSTTDCPVPANNSQHGFEVSGADVEISLSPTSRKTVLIRANILAANSQYFRVALSDRWSSRSADDSSVRRFEMVFNEDGTDSLVPVTTPTPVKRRLDKLSDWQGGKTERKWHNDIAVMQLKRRDPHRRDSIYAEIGEDESMILEPYPAEEPLAIKVHQLGFALFCGFPLELPCEDYIWDSARILRLVLALLEWIDYYAALKRHATRIIHFILSKNIGARSIAKFPWTYLRIACLLQSEEIYRLCLQACALTLENGRWGPGGRQAYSSPPAVTIRRSHQTFARHVLEGDRELSRNVSELYEWLSSSRDLVIKNIIGLGDLISPVLHEDPITFAAVIWRSWVALKISSNQHRTDENVSTETDFLLRLANGEYSISDLSHIQKMVMLGHDHVDEWGISSGKLEGYLEAAKALAGGLFMGDAPFSRDLVYRSTNAFFSLDCALPTHGYHYPFNKAFAPTTKTNPSVLQLIGETDPLAKYVQESERRQRFLGSFRSVPYRMIDRQLKKFSGFCHVKILTDMGSDNLTVEWVQKIKLPTAYPERKLKGVDAWPETMRRCGCGV